MAKIVRPGSSYGRAANNANRAGFESGIPRPGIKKNTTVTANDDGNINISVAKPTALTFTSSN